MQLDRKTSAVNTANARASACAMLSASALGILSFGAWADGTRLNAAQLEDRFWTCDVLATTQALSAHDGAQCAQWTDELKQRRFGGDFDKLLAWWQIHKPAEHERRTATLLAAKRTP